MIELTESRAMNTADILALAEKHSYEMSERGLCVFKRDGILAFAAELARSAAPAPFGESLSERWFAIVQEVSDHAKENAQALRKYPAMEAEARARELGAQYLIETAQCMLQDDQLAAILREHAPKAAPTPQGAKFSCHLERDFGKTPCDHDCGKLRCMYPTTPQAASPEASHAWDPDQDVWHGATPQPVPSHHPDDVAVDILAAAMKEKLAQARAKGRSGWQECAPEDLSRMLREHVEKGDPRDVANFCAFLWALGDPIYATPQPGPSSEAVARVNSEGFIVGIDEMILAPGTLLYAALPATPAAVPISDAVPVGELVALRRNAARYKVLRDARHGFNAYRLQPKAGKRWRGYGDEGDILKGDDLDAAIDGTILALATRPQGETK